MKKNTFLIASSLSVMIAPSLSADVDFSRAGYSIGGVNDELVEFFDRDNDGYPDALTYGPTEASIFDGRENGFINVSLEAFSSNSLNTSKYITVADMNNDGFQDLITYPFKILINDGQGHFPSIPANNRFSLGGDFFKIQTADLDQNGTVDLFLTGSNRSNNSFSGTTVALMNVTYDPTAKKQGYFSYERTILFSPNNPPLFGNISSMKPNGVKVGDLNNDGMPDVIFINSARGTSSTSTSSVTLNNGSGVMIYSQALSDAEDIALGDLDNDGDLDAVLARSGNQPDEVWYNNGNGVFTNSGQALGNDDSINTAMADLDGDGDLDVVTTSHNINQSSAHKIWINDGSGQLSLSAFSFGYGVKTESLKLLDLDKDGDTDIVTHGGKAFYPQENSIFLSTNQVWLNQLVSNDYSFDLDAAIELCKNNPNDYGLFDQNQMDQALIYAFSEGISACQTAPHDYGLFDQADLENELISGISQGEQNCKDNPESCNLFGQTEIDEAILLGMLDGQASGIVVGKQSCIDDPSTCNLFDQNALNTAEENGIDAGTSSGIIIGRQACIDDPDSCDLFDQNALNNAEANGIDAGTSSGIIIGKQACIDDPGSCDLFDQNALNDAEAHGIDAGQSSGIILGRQACIDNPASCNLFDQNALTQAEANSFDAGRAIGINVGQQACIDNPSICDLYDQTDLNEAKINGTEIGFINGKQACIDDPTSCGLFSLEQVNENTQDLINQIISELPKGKLKQICKKNPSALLCKNGYYNNPQHYKYLIKNIIKDLPKGFHKSFCKKHSNSLLCDKSNPYDGQSYDEVIQRIISDLPRGMQSYICKKKPNSPICENE